VSSTESRTRTPAAAGRRRPRVLHVGKFYPPHMGGMETHLQVLCRGLRSEVDVRVLVASDTRRHSVELIDGIEVTRAGTAFNLAGAPVCPGMVRAIREARAEIVHLHLPNPAAILAYLASGYRGRLVVSYHSDVVRQRALDAAFRPILHATLAQADAIIAATPNYVESSPVLARFRSRCHVIPYGIPLDGFERIDSAVGGIRDRFGSRLVVSIGRLVYYKGFDTLIRAMREVQAHLVIVGEGPLRGALEAEVRALGLCDRVTFVGGVDDVVPYCHAADVFVLASVARSEAFGIVQLEAMACGTPVVNTWLDSGVPYVSRDGESGLTVPPAEPGALAGAINRLLDDPALRTEFGRTARSRVEAEFSEGVMVDRTLDLYARLLGTSRDESVPASGPPPAAGSPPVRGPLRAANRR
jgi:glycosyltransferase involved in cell wall biosynthesis